MEPKGPKRAPKDPRNPLKNRERKRHQKGAETKTCLSVGTGSAFKGGEFAKHGKEYLGIISEILKEYLRNVSGTPKEYMRNIYEYLRNA